MISVLVNGANGRMGQTALQAINDDDTLTCVAEGTRQTDLKALINDVKPDVVLDLTIADAVFANTKTIIDANVRPVIGTSGLLPEQIRELQALADANGIGGIIVPNFSLGAVLMMELSEQVAKYLPRAEIIEMHHDKKQDSPSGTAISTAERIAAARTDAIDVVKGRESITGARGAMLEDVPIHAVRLPGVLAEQTVVFGNEGETLQIRHASIDRSCFAGGIRLACHKATEFDKLVVGLQHAL